MTVIPEVAAPESRVLAHPVPGPSPDHRGSWIPTTRMITTRFMELGRRRGLMVAMAAVNIGIPTVFLVVRLLAHAIAPKSYGPAGGYDIFTNLVAGVMYVFGFIIAATLGCTAGSSDLTEGVFRHHVVTGRSRLALYLARIPAGLGIVVPMVAAGFVIVCAVCCFAAPTTLNYDGASLPAGLSRTGLEAWAADHPKTVICDFPYNGPITVNVPCGPNGPVPGGAIRVFKGSAGPTPAKATPAQIRAEAVKLARFNYLDYSKEFLSPSNSLMVKAGLWLELEAAVGFIIGLGLSSLLGQRTISVVLILVLELILTPIVSTKVIPHAINLERGVVGLAMAHLEPGHLPVAFSGGGPGGQQQLVPESIGVAICVVVAWVVVWTALGAWRMAQRDA